MRQLPGKFSMRKDGSPDRGNWFRIENKADDEGPAQIYIYDEIGFWGTSASEFVKDLIQIDAKKIDLHLNSPGGEVFDGLAIYNALKQHSAEVTVYVDALAASAASFIACAGDKVIMARNAEMMIHDGLAFCFGNEADMHETGDLLGKISNNIADIYFQRAGGSVEEWRNFMREEVWYSATEAVDAGLADEVLDASNSAKENTDKWDLGFFNHAGRKDAESPLRIRERLQVTNQATEETQMGKPVNNEDGKTTPPAGTETGSTAPVAPAEPEVETAPEAVTPAAAPEAAPAPVAAPAAAQVQGVMINGVMTTDWAAINAHMSALTTAQKEAEETFRKDFVTNLSDTGKISATQVEALTTHVLSLSQEQFKNWSAVYDSAPSAPLFQAHGTQKANEPTAPAAPGSVQNKEQRIADLEGIIALHERTMSPEKVKATKSYAELQTLLSDTTN